jgi:purine-binding chemotaxis protein CheW
MEHTQLTATPAASVASTNSQDAVKKTGNRQIIVFKLGEEEYALSIDQVKEVVVMPKVAKIPLTPAYIRGVANIRGSILAIIDLATKFGLAIEANSEEEKKPDYILVIESDKCKMGVLVKEVPSTLTIVDENIDSSPGIIYNWNSDSGYIKGIVRVGTRMIILMDIFKIISTELLQSSLSTKN